MSRIAIALALRRPPDRRGLAHFAESSEQNVPVPLSAARRAKLPDLAVREGNWKLLCEYDGSQPQLYDLETDVAEANNLAQQQPALVQRLTAAVLAWHRSLPPDNGPNL
jgi:hypothetical protein